MDIIAKYCRKIILFYAGLLTFNLIACRTQSIDSNSRFEPKRATKTKQISKIQYNFRVKLTKIHKK